MARDEAKITHYHEDAGNGSAIVVMLCRHLLEGKSFEEAKELISTNNELKQSWMKVQNAELKPDGYIFNVIHSALYFIKENKSLEDTFKITLDMDDIIDFSSFEKGKKILKKYKITI